MERASVASVWNMPVLEGRTEPSSLLGGYMPIIDT